MIIKTYKQTDEPAFRVPLVILGLVILWLGVYALMRLSPAIQAGFLQWLAFVPANFTAHIIYLPTIVTYSLLHGGWDHVIMNAVWLVAFGSPVATRLASVRRFLAFYAVCCVCAGLAHFIFHIGDAIPVIGASGGVSAMMGAAARFALTGGNWFDLQQNSPKKPLMPLSQTLRCAPVLFFIAIWMGLNLIFGLVGIAPDGQSVQIAWQAHAGGFLAGLLLLSWFDTPPLSASGGPGNRFCGRWIGAKNKDKSMD